MKKQIKRIIAYLLAAAILSACLLPLTGCTQQTAPAPSNPFEDPLQGGKNTAQQGEAQDSSDPESTDGSDNPASSENHVPIGEWGRFFGESDYDASAPHGEKKLCYDEVSNTINRTSYNGIIFDIYEPNINTYEIDDPLTRHYLCFDPTCAHIYKEYCTSSLKSTGVRKDPNDPFSEKIEYPARMVIDSYDYETVPVVYMSFRREGVYFVNDEMLEREAVYCIERYDMKTGARTVVADYINQTIDGLYTYGDYVYFTKVDEDNRHTLCRVHKSGGEITVLSEENNAIGLLDVVDDKLFYLVDDRYICRTDLALTESEQLADIADLTCVEGVLGYYFYGAIDGYIYYNADLETVYSETTSDEPIELGYKMDLYRLPLNDLTAAPEKLVDDMISALFTEDTVFYCPAILEEVEEPIEGEINTCNGTIYALDLNTLERTTVCENTGFNFYFYHVISCEDDIIGVTGRPYVKDTALAGGSNRILMGKKSGGGLKFWYVKGPVEYEN